MQDQNQVLKSQLTKLSGVKKGSGGGGDAVVTPPGASLPEQGSHQQLLWRSQLLRFTLTPFSGQLALAKGRYLTYNQGYC